MNDTVKKKWSKKKKTAVIILCIIAVLLILITAAGITALHIYCKTPEYQLYSTSQDVKLVAHRGYRAVAPENTTASFTQAGEAGFWGAECDLYRTADGKWIITHDSHTYRMMDKSAFVEKQTYDSLMQQTVDNGVNIDDYPDLKFCSLDEYMQICRDYGMTAVIELKGKNNTEYYDEIIDTLANYDVPCVFISFHFENLQKIRLLTDAPVYYLVKKISREDIELAQTIENCGIDFNAEKEKNFESGMIKECIDSGIPVGAWTVNELPLLEKLVQEGVTLITTDNITKSE